uniref:Movement protein n=1 Tax=Grapevine virus B TaxID=35289 RepID=D6PW86_9VIRU|nr:putative movement protein [Grapevine virus B]AHZ62718.1 movement protein [Grapevine virus B]
MSQVSRSESQRYPGWLSGTKQTHPTTQQIPEPTHTQLSVFPKPKEELGVKGVKSAIAKTKVYDLSYFERLFPTRVFKSVVHEEIRVRDGEVKQVINLMDEDFVRKIETTSYPYLHLGCVAICVIPHGRDLKGEVEFTLRDTRFLPRSNPLMSFGCKAERMLSAFSAFPGYFVSTYDLIDGFTMELMVKAKGMEFEEGVRPMSIQIICVAKLCSQDFHHQYALQKVKKGAYQALLNSYLVQCEDQTEYLEVQSAEGVPDRSGYTGIQVKSGQSESIDKLLVPPEVYETISKQFPESHGKYIPDGKDKEQHLRTPMRRSDLRN